MDLPLASRIAPRLYQGSRPLQGTTLRRVGFDTLVLAAKEHQPSARRFPGVEVIHVPMDDVDRPLSSSELRRVRRASARVARRLVAGRRVLVTCHAGLNRSGIITAGALILLTGADACSVVRRVRQQRSPDALSNPSFVEALSGRRHC